MNRVPKECRAIQRDLARHKELNAVRRSELDVHLRRCPSCAMAASRLSRIETEKPTVSELTEERSRQIYDRLLPAVHEIAVNLQHQPAPRPLVRPLLVSALATAAVTTLILVSGYRNPPPVKESAQTLSTPEQKDDQLVSIAATSDCFIDRMEGDVHIQGTDASAQNGVFSLQDGITVEMKKSARFNFRIGNLARIALLDATLWRVEEISDDLISIELDRGKLAVAFDGSFGTRLEIRTPDSIVRVKGTTFTVEVEEGHSTRVGVVEGQVEVLPIRGNNGTLEVNGKEMAEIPGEGRVTSLGDAQRALAGQVEEALEDSLVATFGRMVRFDGSPSRVRVEVENRLLGYTPLTVRLPEGPVYYRLIAPGMETYEAKLEKEQTGEQVLYSMEPSANYQPMVTEDARIRLPKQRKQKVSDADEADKASWNLVVRARAAMTAGDIPFAARLLEEASHGLEGDRLVTVLSLLAECFSATGQYKKAADTFDKVAGLVPGTKIAQNSRYEVGRLSMDHIGDYGRARTSFTSYIASPLGGHLKEDAYFSLCELYGKEGVQRSALHCFNDFVRLFPDGYRQPMASLWRGVLYQEVEQRWSDAERDLMAFVRAKPRHPRCEEARYRIALGRYHTGDKRGALRMLQEYLKEHATGQYKLRVERLKRAILDPNFLLSPDSR